MKRKRGRPKGSKNKPKDDQNFTADFSEDTEDVSVVDDVKQFGASVANFTVLVVFFKSTERKSGKAKNMNKKVYQLPPVPEDKVVVYSLILSDINERFMSQNKIKCLPGL